MRARKNFFEGIQNSFDSVVKLIEKHEEVNETQLTLELNNAKDVTDVEVVNKIVNTKQEMDTSAKVLEEFNDQPEQKSNQDMKTQEKQKKQKV